MIIDIEMLGRVVRRIDSTTVLKSFVALLVPFIVLTNLEQTLEAQEQIIQFGREEEEMGWLFLAGVLLSFAPLGFVVGDWAARHRNARYISLAANLLVGSTVFYVTGLVLSPLLDEIRDEALYQLVFPAVGIAAFFLAGFGRLARGSRYLVGLAALLQGASALVEAFQGEVGIDAALNDAFVTGLLGWILIRDLPLLIASRVVLASTLSRSMLFGALQLDGIGVRLAQLVGLPSVLWSRAAMRTKPFWIILLARPTLYIGLVLCGSAETLMALTYGVLLLVMAHLSFQGGKRLAARSRSTRETESSGAAPILFLRSFQDDRFDFRRSRWDLSGRWLDLWSFRRNGDEALVDEMAQYGSVIALGKRGDDLLDLGAERWFPPDGDWKTLVRQLVRQAQAIVLVAGDTDGVLWEFDLIVEQGLLARTILLFRPDAASRALNQRALEAFSKASAAAGSVPPSPPSDAELVALWQSDQGPVLFTAKKPMASHYLLALRAHFQRCDPTDLARSISPLDATPSRWIKASVARPPSGSRM